MWVPPSYILFGGTVPPSYVLFGGTVPPSYILFGGTVPPNNFTQKELSDFFVKKYKGVRVLIKGEVIWRNSSAK